jgi:hypothetical protein
VTNLLQINSDILTPALTQLGPKFDTPNARRMLLAIGLQESGFATTVQYGGGPAHGYWQFEKGGGCKGVLTHPASRNYAEVALQLVGLPPLAYELWTEIAKPEQQVLAAKMARLLLWTDVHLLPVKPGDGWECYQRNWRPGKPHPEKWLGCWNAASAALGIDA